MPRDYEQKQFALVMCLRERGVEPRTFDIGPESGEEYARNRDITIAFSTGWDGAQKWERTEAQRQGIAVQAMNGLLGNTSFDQLEDCTIAKEAYNMADAMMVAAKDGVSQPETTADKRRTQFSKQISDLMKAIQYAIDNRGGRFNYDEWIDLCREGGMTGKHTDQR